MKEKKTDNSIEAEVVSESTAKAYPKDTWSINRIFWGMLFVVIGGLTLAANFDLVDVNWMNLWRLWPLMIIAFGLSILSIRHWLWKIASLLLIVATMAAIVWVAVVGEIYSSSVENYTATVKTISGGVKSAKVNITAGASTLVLNSADQSAIAEAKLASNIADIEHSSVIKNGVQSIELNMNPLGESRWWTGDIKSEFNISLCRHLPISVNLDAGASDTQIDLSQAKISNMDIKAGASNLDIKLGSKTSVLDLNIDSGVSSIVVRVPKNSGVQVMMDGGLTSEDMADLKDVGDDYYESDGYASAVNKINISAKIGMSSFTIERY